MENFLKPEISVALGWTLLHSLWQGIMLVILYFGISRFLKSAEIKYRLGIGAMIAQFGLAIGTFMYVGDFKNNNEIIAKNALHYISTKNISPKEISVIDFIQLFFASNINLIVQIWLIGIALFFVKLILDVWSVNRLKNTGLKSVNYKTLEKFNELILKLKITRKIEIFESNQTVSPVVVGNIKPFILLPIGLASSLTINELEAILAHELAHIERYDFLVNILQSIIEIIFFFNPGIWLISAQVRQEREHCCDDFSVSITADKMLLVSALSQVETFRINQHLAMAFGKKRMTLLNRVKRILGVNTKENRNIESIIVMAFVSVILGSLVFFKSDNVIGQTEITTKKIKNSYSKNQVPKENTGISTIVKIENNLLNEKLASDTVILQKTASNSENRIIEEYNNEHKYINSFTKNGNFWINRVGEIYVNGKKYDASPELIENIKPFLKNLDGLNDEMEIYSKKMNVFSKEMKVYSDKMQDKSKPMQDFGKQMEVQGKLLEEQVKLQTKYSLKASLADLENEKSEKLNFQKLEKEHEKKVDEISKEMDRLGKEMEKLGELMEENGKPMEEIGKKMEVEGKQMEIIGNKMEVVSREMIKILPDDLKKKIKEIERGYKE
ncbi:MAG: hypothetical protein RLZZ306_1756 [Bacteroidota bacterium]